MEARHLRFALGRVAKQTGTAGRVGIAGTHQVRHRGTEGEVALAARKWRDPLRLPHDWYSLYPCISLRFLPFALAPRADGGSAEPAVASSDATNISCSIVRKADGFVINGTKCAVHRHFLVLMRTP
jgi:hypothetical protein